jgi:hypothetical protein
MVSTNAGMAGAAVGGGKTVGWVVGVPARGNPQARASRAVKMRIGKRFIKGLLF